MNSSRALIRIAVVDSGVANLASVLSAFRELETQATLVHDPSELAGATHLVLPGVGSFASGMNTLRESGFDAATTAWARAGKPLLAVCLGMQLLTEGSEESPGVDGIGVIAGRCRRLPESVRVPQLGWNRIEPDSSPGPRLLQGGMAAFANSYALRNAPEGWRYATTTYGDRFVSVLEKDRILACQFHPELSSRFGLDLLRRWIDDQTVASDDPKTVSGKSSGLEYSMRAGTVRIIPCLDVSDGRVVKGIQFQELRDAGDPAELAAMYESQGADEIVVLDIAASPRDADTRVETVERTRNSIHIPLTVGGGVRSVEDARRLLSAGADKISVNSAAVAEPELISRLATAFGTQCIVCAIDARRKGEAWEVLIRGGRESAGRDVVEWAREAETRGAGEILLTSWDRDGTRAGADEPLLATVSSSVSIPVIASGGIGNPTDALNAVRSGASAVLAASIFHDADLEVSDIKTYLAEAGLEVRL